MWETPAERATSRMLTGPSPGRNLVPRCDVTATMMFSRHRNVKEPGRDDRVVPLSRPEAGQRRLPWGGALVEGERRVGVVGQVCAWSGHQASSYPIQPGVVA